MADGDKAHLRSHPPLDEWRVLKFAVAGGFAGAVSRTATAPIDRLKMLLQVQEGTRPMTIREGIQQMAAEGTLRSYFKGNGANVLKIAPETALKFTLNDALKLWVSQDADEITPLERVACGGLAGAVAQGLIYPLDTVRTRLAVSMDPSRRSISSVAAEMHRAGGISAFYRGLVPSMCGILPYAGVDIAVFEMLKDVILERYEGTPPPLLILGAGMLSSTVAQFVSYPLALIRTRLQAQGTDGGVVRYRGMGDVLRQTLQREGLRGLYKGAIPNLLKLAPAAGISWFVFEETKIMLGVDPRS